MVLPGRILLQQIQTRLHVHGRWVERAGLLAIVHRMVRRKHRGRVLLHALGRGGRRSLILFGGVLHEIVLVLWLGRVIRGLTSVGPSG